MCSIRVYKLDWDWKGVKQDPEYEKVWFFVRLLDYPEYDRESLIGFQCKRKDTVINDPTCHYKVWLLHHIKEVGNNTWNNGDNLKYWA